jgi:hypothetical protein
VLVGWCSQIATDAAAEDTKKELELLKKRDMETERYAKHSKAALGKMFDSVRGIESNDDSEGGRPAMKLPPIQWHPRAVEREKEAKAAASEKAAKARGEGRDAVPPSKIPS